MNVVERRFLVFVVRGRQANTPIPSFVKSLYLRFRTPCQSVQPLTFSIIDLLHCQSRVDGVVQVKCKERRPQLTAIIQLQHAVHFDTFWTRIGIMLYARKRFFRVQFVPQFGRIGHEKHIAIHEQHPPRQPHGLGDVRNKET